MRGAHKLGVYSKQKSTCFFRRFDEITLHVFRGGRFCYRIFVLINETFLLKTDHHIETHALANVLLSVVLLFYINMC